MVDLKKLQTLDQLIPQQPAKAKMPVPGADAGPSFAETMNQVEGVKPQNLAQLTPQGLMKAPAAGAVKFSNHAIERMQTRGISYSPEQLSKLSEAVSKAAAKGSKDSLILMNDSALIVSVKNNTVVTVMDKNALKENVFTNIDSTVVL
jgi:flagellar operon protein